MHPPSRSRTAHHAPTSQQASSQAPVHPPPLTSPPALPLPTSLPVTKRVMVPLTPFPCKILAVLLTPPFAPPAHPTSISSLIVIGEPVQWPPYLTTSARLSAAAACLRARSKSRTTTALSRRSRRSTRSMNISSISQLVSTPAHNAAAKVCASLKATQAHGDGDGECGGGAAAAAPMSSPHMARVCASSLSTGHSLSCPVGTRPASPHQKALWLRGKCSVSTPFDLLGGRLVNDITTLSVSHTTTTTSHIITSSKPQARRAPAPHR